MPQAYSHITHLAEEDSEEYDDSFWEELDKVVEANTKQAQGPNHQQQHQRHDLEKQQSSTGLPGRPPILVQPGIGAADGSRHLQGQEGPWGLQPCGTMAGHAPVTAEPQKYAAAAAAVAARQPLQGPAAGPQPSRTPTLPAPMCPQFCPLPLGAQPATAVAAEGAAGAGAAAAGADVPGAGPGMPAAWAAVLTAEPQTSADATLSAGVAAAAAAATAATAAALQPDANDCKAQTVAADASAAGKAALLD